MTALNAALLHVRAPLQHRCAEHHWEPAMTVSFLQGPLSPSGWGLNVNPLPFLTSAPSGHIFCTTWEPHGSLETTCTQLPLSWWGKRHSVSPHATGSLEEVTQSLTKPGKSCTALCDVPASLPAQIPQTPLPQCTLEMPAPGPLHLLHLVSAEISLGGPPGDPVPTPGVRPLLYFHLSTFPKFSSSFVCDLTCLPH